MGGQDLRRIAVRAAAAGALVAGGLGAVGAEGPPPTPTAETPREERLRAEAEAAIRDGLEKVCLQEGKHWDDVRRECVYLMRSKD